ncbi:MAG: iron-containing redox enzyme family protein [Cyanobacteria bacterium]|nr:iron-containing redox enzyme family protein [Cyanobacteriota bacterium]
MTCFADLPLVLQEQINHNDQAKPLDTKEALIEQEDFSQKVYLIECDQLAKLPSSDCESTFQQFITDPVSLTSLTAALVRLQEDCIKDEAANDGYNSAYYVDYLAALALQHRAVCHPYLWGMAAGTLPSLYAALQDFARHYYGYSAHFPRYLTALISKLENPEHRAALLENLTEESGQYEEEELMQLKEFGVQPEWIVGIPHPVLFKRFRNSLGVDNAAMDDDHIEVVCWREQFLAIMNTGSAAEALGALGLGTETIVQTIYQPFVEAIQKVGSIKPEDAVFFPLHTAVDDHHQATLKAIAIDFAATPAGRADLAKGMFKALALRDSFWSWLYARAQGENGT